jgi:hypothetical protein
MGCSEAAEVTLEQVLCCLCEREINCSVASSWDLGVDVKLGDEINGFVATERFHPDELYGKPLGAAAGWLWRAACEHYPSLAEERDAGRITWIVQITNPRRQRQLGKACPLV